MSGRHKHGLLKVIGESCLSELHRTELLNCLSGYGVCVSSNIIVPILNLKEGSGECRGAGGGMAVRSYLGHHGCQLSSKVMRVDGIVITEYILYHLEEKRAGGRVTLTVTLT